MHIPRISVIVPVYRTEKYLNLCIRSILAQTFADFELILVDDGSPDRCGEICDQYAEKDARITVIHKENRGVSAARNAGIDMAQGSFITFMDSDDYAAPDLLETLYHMLIRSGADAASCGVYECGAEYVRSLSYNAVQQALNFQTIDTQEAVRRILISKLPPYCNAILYPSQLFSDVRFPEGKTYAEDTYTVIRALAKTARVCITELEKYYYIRHEESITTSAYSSKLLSSIELWGKSFAFVKEIYPSLSLQAERMYLLSAFGILVKMTLSPVSVDPQEKQYVVDIIRKNLWKIVKNPYIGKADKISCLCLLVDGNLYRLFSRLLPTIRAVRSGRKR